MNDSKSSMILIGIGGAGSAAARGVSRAFGPGLRYVLADTDAATGAEGEPFVLLGGDRLDVVARVPLQDAPPYLSVC